MEMNKDLQLEAFHTIMQPGTSMETACRLSKYSRGVIVATLQRFYLRMCLVAPDSASLRVDFTGRELAINGIRWFYHLLLLLLNQGSVKIDNPIIARLYRDLSLLLDR